MASAEVRDALAKVFTDLRLAGFKAPDAWGRQQPAAIVDVWLTMLPADITADEIREAGLRWGSRPHDGFVPQMPTPGQLVDEVRPRPSDADLGAAGRAAWAVVLDVQRQCRESTGNGGRVWRSERHEEHARRRLGPTAWSALEVIGGYARLERAQLGTEKDVADLAMVFVADFRTFANRQISEGEPLMLPAPVAPRRVPSTTAPMLSETPTEMHPRVASILARVLRGDSMEEVRREICAQDLASDNVPLRRS